MGVYSNFYMGPAIIIEDTKRQIVDERYSCKNKECDNHTKHISSPFCGKCGTEITLIEHKYEGRLSLYALIEDEEDLYDIFNIDILAESGDKPIITIMNRKEFFLEIGTGDYSIVKNQDACMDSAKDNDNIKKVLSILDKNDIKYKFEFIAIAYYY